MLDNIKKYFILNSSQRKRLKNNILSGFSTDLVQIITQIAFAPLMIIFWGVEKFGIWLFLLSIPNILLVFNLNFNGASINEMTMFNSKKNYKKSNEIFQNSIIFTLINIFFFSLLLFFLYFFKDFDFIILKNIKYDELIIILFFLITSIYFNFINSLFSIGLQSYGKHYVTFNVSNITDLLSKIFIVISGIYFNSLIIPAKIYFLFILIKFFLNFYFFNLNRKHIFFSFKYVSKRSLKKLFKLSIGHTSHMASNLISHSGVIFVLGIFYNPYIVGYIATVKTLFYFFPIRFFTKLNHILYYEIARLYALNKIKLLKNNFYNYIKFIFVLVVIFILLSLSIGPFVYDLWLNNKYHLSFILLLFIVLDSSFFAIKHSISSLLDSINKNIILGISELLIILVGITLFYFISNFNYSYVYGFGIIMLGSLLNLIISYVLVSIFFKSKK